MLASVCDRLIVKDLYNNHKELIWLLMIMINCKFNNTINYEELKLIIFNNIINCLLK